ncbi:VCBS repeat-containing protein, partial [bacterium]|nr:VCBS repeat-containing protein [bacterium]
MADVFGADKNLGVDYSKNLPLQNNTVLMAPDKELFFTGRHDTSLSPQLRFMDNPTASSAPYIAGLPAIASGAVKWWENPKKATTMVNANGRESTVIAVWNEAVAGQTFGYKDITLHIIGDESVNYAHQSMVLPDKFWMPTIVSGVAYSGATMGAYDIQEAWQWEMMLRTGDVTGDGVPEILVAVHDTLRIYTYNGTNLTKIHERGFISDFRDLNKEYAFCLRIEVADMNQDGKNDI